MPRSRTIIGQLPVSIAASPAVPTAAGRALMVPLIPQAAHRRVLAGLCQKRQHLHDGVERREEAQQLGFRAECVSGLRLQHVIENGRRGGRADDDSGDDPQVRRGEPVRAPTWYPHRVSLSRRESRRMSNPQDTNPAQDVQCGKQHEHCHRLQHRRRAFRYDASEDAAGSARGGNASEASARRRKGRSVRPRETRTPTATIRSPLQGAGRSPRPPSVRRRRRATPRRARPH